MHGVRSATAKDEYKGRRPAGVTAHGAESGRAVVILAILAPYVQAPQRASSMATRRFAAVLPFLHRCRKEWCGQEEDEEVSKQAWAPKIPSRILEDEARSKQQWSWRSLQGSPHLVVAPLRWKDNAKVLSIVFLRRLVNFANALRAQLPSLLEYLNLSKLRPT